MTHENEAPAKYEVQENVGLTVSGLAAGSYQSASASSELQETWGQPYVPSGPSASGWQAAISASQIFGSPATWTATLFTPNNAWGSYSNSGAGFIGGLWDVIIDGEFLDVNPDCTWTYGFATFDAWLTMLGGALIHAITYAPLGGYSVSGTGYDRRLNGTKLIPAAAGLFDSAPGLTCASIVGDELVQATVTGGYQKLIGGVGTPDPVLVDNTTISSGCPCAAGLPGLGATNSFNVTASASWELAVTKSAEVAFTCPCSTGGGATGSGHQWNLTQTYQTTAENVMIVWDAQKMGPQEIDVTWVCDNNGTTTSSSIPPDVTTPTLTTCASDRTVTNDVQVQHGCNRLESFTGPCDGGSFTCEPCFDCSLTHCSFFGEVKLWWPMKPPCTGSVSDVDDLQTITGDHYLTFIDQNGDLWSWWSPKTETNWMKQTNITGTLAFAGGWSSPRICRDNERLHIIAYHAHQGGGDPLSSGLYHIYSDSDGGTWSPISGGALAPELLSASATMGMMRTSIDGQALRILFFPDSGITGPGTFKSQWKANEWSAWSSLTTLVDASASNLHSAGYRFGFDHAKGNADRWILSFVASGGASILEYHSADLKTATWEQYASISATGATDVQLRAAIDGPLIRIVAIPDTGTSGSATFKGQYKSNSWTSWSAFTTMKDDTGANLHSAGYQWGFDHASESADRWSHSFVKSGGTLPNCYFIADKAQTASYIA